MVVRPYVPDAGDLVWLDFAPSAGHEQAGHRPAVVLSPASYNSRTSLAVLVPVTSRKKGYPFEVELPSQLRVTGVALSDQVKNLDWKQRKASYAGKVPSHVLTEIKQRLAVLLGLASP